MPKYLSLESAEQVFHEVRPSPVHGRFSALLILLSRFDVRVLNTWSHTTYQYTRDGHGLGVEDFKEATIPALACARVASDDAM